MTGARTRFEHRTVDKGDRGLYRRHYGTQAETCPRCKVVILFNGPGKGHYDEWLETRVKRAPDRESQIRERKPE